MGLTLSYQSRRELLQQMVPRYREASASQKRALLDDLVTSTGYARRYAMWLLNHPREGQPPPERHRQRLYGPEVQQALVEAWNAANRICAKRFIPFLPTLLDTLERHERLHLTEPCRRQLLSMSAATADRLLHSQRIQGPRGLCTTHAGTLLKQQIPIRTFRQWNEAQPGFVEADLVAHCGWQKEGGNLYTLTLTDIATGWTECLPLLSKSQDQVVAAFEQARERFPFPILGLDTDNGTEFINAALLSYCQQQQMTFTRGRPDVKNDQCFVEQKNGNLVRQVVGYDRFAGPQAYAHLIEVYRAFRLYVNYFQPSMKLQAKQYEGRKARLVYDGAKTPLQRLLLSQLLPASKQQELMQLAQALDPVRLLHQIEGLQQQLFASMMSVSSSSEGPAVGVRVEEDAAVPCAPDSLRRESASNPQEQTGSPLSTNSLLDWHRRRDNPFKEVWELIASWVCADPRRSCGEIFQHLQRLFPQCYQPSHLRTLQRGVRKIRERLQEAMVRSWHEDVIQGQASEPPVQGLQERERSESTAGVSANVLTTAIPACQQNAGELALRPQPLAEKEATATTAGTQNAPASSEAQPHAAGRLLPPASYNGFPQTDAAMTLGHAIQDYLQHEQHLGRRPKTLQWHQRALGLFREYLCSEWKIALLSQITQAEVQGWLAFLRQMPMGTGTLRAASTVESSARSVRAFFQWLVRDRCLACTPFAHLTLPNVGSPLLHLLEAREWERLLLACRPPGETSLQAERATARNQAILWVFADTGMRVSELCGLCLSDIDREHGRLRVQKKGSKPRQLALSQDGLRALLAYLDEDRPDLVACLDRRDACEEHLFLSEACRPLTDNGIALLFRRLRKRAGIARKGVGPSLLRDTFAVRYLQAGGDLFTLRELLGQEESAVVKRFLRINEEVSENEKRKENSENSRW